ncbi:MLO-like protein 13 isoform X2 [Magnolia sinica]|uniref:MLO-like protein 13 isoform X2 n=2 Tax=Magnolia sinica TaxID=86752 RepID=UPI00265AA9E5|nr:MLO-like protein 13 isoform X2 [Magnolia sinica]
MAGESVSFEHTPTWVVAVVCSIIIIVSLFVERMLHYLGKCLKHNRQDALFEALQKLKEELMLLGFISLLLTVFQSLISHICIRTSLSYHMLPCKRYIASAFGHENHHHDSSAGLTWNRRLLSGGTTDHCAKQGKVPLLSIEALHQLHIFIFVLAVVYVVFCATTMVLGGAKIRQWKRWENSIEHEISKHETSDTGNTFHVHHHHVFITERTKGYWGSSTVVTWVMSFFKQFYGSVTKSDYAALRLGFIMKHCSSNPHFDFHKYIMRVLETDFKKVVGISWYLWLLVVVFLLLNVDGWHSYFWLSFLPLILLLLVGAKLQNIITCMAQVVAEKHEDASVKLSDEHFWFDKPRIVLYLIHFILFQNSFEMAFFFWILSTYGFHSCIMEKVGYVVPRLIIGVLIQVLCSYSTLPLYAIVTQMGGMFKQEIFGELQGTLKGWAEGARKRKKTDGVSSSVWGAHFGKSDKNSSTIGAVQMQKMPVEALNSAHVADQAVDLDEITTSVIEHLDSRQISQI